jgi:tetratricopeptide (TPR) repeat protein
MEAACAWDKAMEAAQAGVKKWPDDPLMVHHLGVAYYNVGKFVEAMGAYRKAIEMKPDFAMAHCDLSALLILTGDAEGGWREYEWRWRAVEPGRLHAKFTGATFWDGSDLAGKRIILHTEGGFGDAIQYFRYAPMMAKRGARVIVRCQRGVVELFKTLRGVERVIGVEEELPEFDWHCALFSVPRVMGVVVGDVPYYPGLICGRRRHGGGGGGAGFGRGS